MVSLSAITNTFPSIFHRSGPALDKKLKYWKDVSLLEHCCDFSCGILCFCVRLGNIIRACGDLNTEGTRLFLSGAPVSLLIGKLSLNQVLKSCFCFVCSVSAPYGSVTECCCMLPACPLLESFSHVLCLRCVYMNYDYVFSSAPTPHYHATVPKGLHL